MEELLHMNDCCSWRGTSQPYDLGWEGFFILDVDTVFSLNQSACVAGTPRVACRCLQSPHCAIRVQEF